jgi:hypothetical protein
VTNISIVKSDPPETKQILAEAITRIGDGFTSLLASGVNKKAITILIQAETKLPQRDIIAVLDALPRLKGWYCR